MDFRLTEEQLALQSRMRKWVAEKLAPMADEVDESYDILPKMVKAMAEEGLFRFLFPKEYGGLGEAISSMKLCIIREEISKASLVADTTFAMNGLGCYPIVVYGTEEQKRKYIPPLASGEKLGSLGLSEPEAGSDVASMTTTASLQGDHYVLNGRKRWNSNGYAAHTLVVFAKTDPEKRGKGISAFVVEKGMPGFTATKLTPLFAHDLAELFFVDCRVPKENLLGVPGEGMKIALGNLDMFRPTVGASAVGSAQAAFDLALAYAKKRQAFGQAISNFQAIQFKLADMAVQLEAARLLVYRAAVMHDQGFKGLLKEASMAKLFATEALQFIASQALRIHGGLGVIKGYKVERIYRQAPGALMGEGTSEMQLLTIARQLLK